MSTEEVGSQRKYETSWSLHGALMCSAQRGLGSQLLAPAWLMLFFRSCSACWGGVGHLSAPHHHSVLMQHPGLTAVAAELAVQPPSPRALSEGWGRSRRSWLLMPDHTAISSRSQAGNDSRHLLLSCSPGPAWVRPLPRPALHPAHSAASPLELPQPPGLCPPCFPAPSPHIPCYHLP